MKISTKLSPREQTVKDESMRLSELVRHYNESEKDIAKIRDGEFGWDEREKLLVGILSDAGSQKTKSKVNTQDLVNLVLDGASRVTAQLPTGTIQAVTEDDKGKNILMSLVHEKYIIPNANAQWDYQTKVKMLDIYSRVYGSMPVLVDYRVEDQYIGPDFWLIHPRSFFPQAGCVNIQEMQHCQIETWVSVEYLESRDKTIWKNISALVKKAKEQAVAKGQKDNRYIPVNERNKTDLSPEQGQFAQVCLRTEYTRNQWTTYAPDYNMIVRDIPNPQGNSELPVEMKHCFPLIDRLYGLAEFERGYTLQYFANSLVNMYAEGVAMSIFPPLMLDQNGIVASSIEYKYKAKWLMTKPNSISQLQLSPQGLNTFNSTYQFIKSQLLNLGATTDTSVSKDSDPGMGKTPEALKQQSSREGARDAWDRFMIEQTLEKITNKFIGLLTTKQEKPISLLLFKKDIEQLQEAYPDEKIVKVFNSGNAGEIAISKSMWGEGVKYKYLIDPGSTMKKDEEAENTAITNVLTLVLKIPGAMEQIAQTGKFTLGDKEFDFGFALKRYIATSGVQDAEKIIRETKDDPQAQQKQDSSAQISQQVQQIGQQQQQMMQVIQKLMEKSQTTPKKSPAESINYKDAPDDIKRQIEAQAGMTPSTMLSPKPEGVDPTTHALNHINSLNQPATPAVMADPLNQ